MRRFLPSLAPAVLAVLVGGVSACSPNEDVATAEDDNTATSDKPYDGTCAPSGDVCAYFAPTDMPIHAVIAAIRGAQRSIRIATYNINIPEIADVLRARLDAGVKVELMEDFKHAVEDERDDKSVWRRVGQHPNLVKYKLPVLRGGTPQMHDKILLVDDERVFFGSANWTFTGLVGNFENVMAIRDPHVVAKFAAELDELRAFAHLACETFAVQADECGKGTERYGPEFEKLALEGRLHPAPEGPVDRSKPFCAALVDGRGLLIAGNQPRIPTAEALTACFVDGALGEKFVRFVKRAAEIERYVDGTEVKADPPVVERAQENGRSFDVVKFRHRDTQEGRTRLYFGGEDDIESTMLRELRALEEHPGEAFAYLSTNFLTNARLVGELVRLHERGVRLRVFFDRGRFFDPRFHSQFHALSRLGFTLGLGANKLKVERAPFATSGVRYDITQLAEREDEDSLAKSVVSVFDNDLSGRYGANHNKFAVLGRKGADGQYHVTLMNGSANWSAMAMRQNDENLIVLEDPYVASIYLREMISQLYVYRYGQDDKSRGLDEDIAFVASRVPCVHAVLGTATDACPNPAGGAWKPPVSGALVMAVKGVPASPADGGARRVWAWVSNWQSPTAGAPPGRAFELFSSHTFEGKWVTSIPYAPSSELSYKFFTAPPAIDPNKDGLGAPGIEWEYGGAGNDRRDTLGARPLMTIRSSNLHWGSP